METALFIVGGIGCWAAMLLGLRKLKRTFDQEQEDRTKRDLMFQRFVETYGGHYEAAARHSLKDPIDRIATTWNGISATFDLERDATGSQMCWRARSIRSHVPSCTVHPRAELNSAPSSRHGTAVALERSAEFDARFVVTCKKAPVVRELLSERAMEMMLGLSRARLRVSSGRFELSVPGALEDIDQLKAGFDLVSELASRDCHGAVAIREFAGSGYESTKQGPVGRVDGPTPVVFETATVGPTLVTVARVTSSPGMEPLTIEVDDAGNTGLRRAALPQAAQMLLPQVGAGRLIIDAERTRFEWTGVQRDPARLRAGARLLGALFTGRVGGVFR